MAYGIIYKITCLVNNKSYIGKTKSHYGIYSYGAIGRFKRHISDAFSNKPYGCTSLYKAVRKHGKDNFKVETLLECDLEDVDMFEIKMISLYDTANSKYGYNIALGGKGRSVVFVSEEIRKKISETQSETKMNIKPFYKSGNIVGYRARRKERGKTYQKLFANTKYTVSENYTKALNYIEEIKNNKIPSENLYNKIDDLPPGITKAENRSKQHIGYKVSYMVNRKKYHKQFGSDKFTMEEKKVFATDWLEQIKKENYTYISPYDHNEIDMTNLTVSKNKKGIPTGYVVKIIYKGKTYKKGFESNIYTMEEKYEQAIEYRNELLINVKTIE